MPSYEEGLHQQIRSLKAEVAKVCKERDDPKAESDTRYGGQHCPNCLEPCPLLGLHTCRPSYQELKVKIAELRAENIILDGRVKTRDERIDELQASNEQYLKVNTDVTAENIELRRELDEERDIIAEFGEWYSESGCPVTETKEGFCPDLDGCRADHEKENLKLDECDRFEFDSEDCDTQMNCGKCYAEYYRMKYREKTALPSATPTKVEKETDCEYQRVDGCYNLGCINRGGPCAEPKSRCLGYTPIEEKEQK